MRWIEALNGGGYYHIYNQGINGEPIFNQPEHYESFLNKYEHYLRSVVDTLAYSLSQNHFHMLVYVKRRRTIISNPVTVSRQFSHFFNAYAQSFNRQQHRTGGLFESPFRRRRLQGARAVTDMICQIHRDPQELGLVKDFRRWPHSSYRAYLDHQPGIVTDKGILDWFETREAFVQFHQPKIIRVPQSDEHQRTAAVPVLGK